MTREKDQQIHFRATKDEVARIRQKMEEAGMNNMAAYLRKMALEGQCIRLDLSDVREMVSLLRRCSNNLNQYARQANATGSIYRQDIRELQERLEQIWRMAQEILKRLAEL